MLKVDPFQMSDLDYFQPLNFEGDLASACAYSLDNPNMRNLATMRAPSGVVIALVGTHTINRDCLEVFLIPSRILHKYAKEVIKSLRVLISVLLSSVVRVQMPVLEHNRKWAETLGFEYEGVVKKYFGCEDHFMYVKTR